MEDTETILKNKPKDSVDEREEGGGIVATPKLLFSDFLSRFQSSEKEIKTTAWMASRGDSDVKEKKSLSLINGVTPKQEVTPIEKEKQKAKLPDEIIRPELNIEKHADFIFIPSHSKKVSQPRRREGWIILADGSKTKSYLEISPIVGGKTPTTRTRKIYLALQKIYEEKKREGKLNHDGSMTVSSKEVVETAMLSWGGKHAKKVHEEIRALRTCMFEWAHTFIASNGQRYKILSTANILDKYEYVTKEDRKTREEQYQAAHIIRFGEHIRNNLDANKTKPVNYTTVLSIQGELALVLYTRLDIILADKEFYCRTSKGIFEDLDLTDEAKYQYPSGRKQVLEKAIKELNGKFITTGILKLHLEKTAEGTDWKLMACKIPVIPAANKTKRRIASANKPDMITCLGEDIGAAIGLYKKNRRLYEMFAVHYPATLIYQAISEYKADGQGAKHPVRFFVGIVHRLAHQSGSDWIKPCPEDCKFRPAQG